MGVASQAAGEGWSMEGGYIYIYIYVIKKRKAIYVEGVDWWSCLPAGFPYIDLTHPHGN